MSNTHDDKMTGIYNALGNPYRRQIISILRTKGKAGFKDLHRELRISVGALYHHLAVLEGLVTQSPDKKYVLTDLGRSAIDSLSVSEEKIATATPKGPKPETTLAFLAKELLFGRSLFHYLNQQPLTSLPLAVLIAALGGWLSSQTGLEPLLLFFVSPSVGINRLWFIVLFPLGWLGTFAISEALSVGLFQRKGGRLSLLTSSAFAMLPLLVVPGIFYLFSLNPRTPSVFLVLVPVVLQAWVMCLLSAAITFSKGLRMERTALISLAVVYLNIVVLLVLLQAGLF